MSASVSSTANIAATTTLNNISAWLSKAAAYSLNTSAEAANPSTPTATAADVVSLSPRAQLLFEALDVLNSTSSQDLQGSYAGQFGNISVSVTGGFGAQASAYSENVRGDERTLLDVDAGSSVENITTVNDGASGDAAASIIDLNGNNDSVNATSNGIIVVVGTTGDYNITTNTTGVGFGLVLAGSGNSTVTLNGDNGLVSGGSGDDTFYLNASATSSGDISASGGSGTTTVIGTGEGISAYGGVGTLIATGVQTFGAGAGTAIVSFSGTSDEASFGSGFTSDTINLSDATIAAGTTVTNASTKLATARTDYVFYADNRGIVPVSADAEGNYSGASKSYVETLPTEGQAGYGLAHANVDFRGYSESDFTSVLAGDTLTITNASTGGNVTLNNYQAGTVTFSYFNPADNTVVTTREPPGLTSSLTASSS